MAKEKKTKKLIVLVTPSEKKKLETEATKRGISLAALVRERLKI